MKTPSSKDTRFWNRIADKYSRDPVKDQESWDFKRNETNRYLKPDMRLLEFGCGTGTVALFHAPHVQHILATDVSSEMLRIAQDKTDAAGVTNITFQEDSLESFEGEAESFDAILAISLIHLLEDPAKAIAKIHALLKPGGVFIQTTACLADDMPIAKFILPVVRLFGQAPATVTFFSEETLYANMEIAGFNLLQKWRPGKTEAWFLVAQKESGTERDTASPE